MPEAALDRALVLQWMFFEQYNHEPNIATARYWLRHGHLTDGAPPALRAEAPRAAMPRSASWRGTSQTHDFFVGGRYSIADIALYAYTHVADQGGFDLGRFPAVTRLARAGEGAAGAYPDVGQLGEDR